MAYASIEDVKKVLSSQLFDYPEDIDAQLEQAKSKVDGALAGHYQLPFDDTNIYTAVPVQIRWITSYLVASYLWSSQVALEGQTDDTAGGRWFSMAQTWLKRISEGKDRLTTDDGTLIPKASGGTGSPRGTDRTSEDEPTWFTREQAHNW